LHVSPDPRMYEGLKANTPGCVAFSLPVQRRILPELEGTCVFPDSLHSQRRARLTRRGGFEPERRPVPRYIFVYLSAPGTV
jgi:hypothetical protein